MTFYIIIAALISLSCIWSIISVLKEIRNKHPKDFYMDIVRDILIDILVISFCLSKIFPGMTWL